jgi:hypothetical protein
MALDTRWARLGAKAADQPYCRAFAVRAAGWGWSADQIDRAVAFGLKHQEAGWERFEPLAIRHVHAEGLADTDLDQALGWVETLREAPGERAALEAEAAAEMVHERPGEARLAEIAALMQADPKAYWRDPALIREHEALVAAREGEAPAAPRLAAADKRLAEIRALMGQDGGRAYWNDPAVQAEHFALVEAQEGGAETAPAATLSAP